MLRKKNFLLYDENNERSNIRRGCLILANVDIFTSAKK